MTHGVVSAGYEGRSMEEFVAALQELEVGTVADVRLNAISRNACFSKSRLREALASAGIGYRHLRSLGNAKENRQPFWTGRVEEGRRVFREALHVPEAEAELHELAELAADHGADAGRHYLEHGEYPPGHFGREPDPEPESAPSAVPRQVNRTAKNVVERVAPIPLVDLSVDSPANKRRRGERPLGDGLFTEDKPDPYDEKILVTVKEAAWMLSLPEHAIRQAVSFGDLDRVFIGDGNRNYRIVYGSLLAWVNSMPRESARPWWAPAGARW